MELEVTATDAEGPGHLTVFAAGTTPPVASDVNFTAGGASADRVIVPVGSRGAVDVASSSGAPDIVVDVSGWFTDGADAGATGAVFTPALAPTRICDTRRVPSAPTACTGDTLGPGSTLTVAAAGSGPVPADATAVVATVTATDTTTPGFLTVSPAGSAVPPVSDLNWVTGRTVANLVTAAIGPDGAVDLTGSAGTADVVVDVVGWYT